MRRLAIFILVAAVLAACGTKGSLYLPPPEGQDGATAKQKNR